MCRLERDPGLPQRALCGRPGALVCRAIRSPRRRCSAGCRWPPASSRPRPGGGPGRSCCSAWRGDPAEVIARSHDLLRGDGARTVAASVPCRTSPPPWPTSPTTPTWPMRRKAMSRSRAYPQVRAWLARIEALPGFVPMAAVAPSGWRHECHRSPPCTRANARCRRSLACASAWRPSARA